MLEFSMVLPALSAYYLTITSFFGWWNFCATQS